MLLYLTVSNARGVVLCELALTPAATFKDIVHKLLQSGSVPAEDTLVSYNAGECVECSPFGVTVAPGLVPRPVSRPQIQIPCAGRHGSRLLLPGGACGRGAVRKLALPVLLPTSTPASLVVCLQHSIPRAARHDGRVPGEGERRVCRQLLCVP